MVMNFLRPLGHEEKIWRWNNLAGLIILLQEAVYFYSYYPCLEPTHILSELSGT